MIKHLILSILFVLSVQPIANALPEDDPLSLRMQKPWLVTLGLGLPRLGPGIYYSPHPQWSLGAHGFILPPAGYGIGTISARYYLSPEPISFFLEPSLGLTSISRTFGNSPRLPQSSVSETSGVAAMELGIEFRFDSGLSISLAGGGGVTIVDVFSPLSYSPSMAFNGALGWAF